MNTNIQIHDVEDVTISHSTINVDGNTVYTTTIMLSSDGSPDQHISLFNKRFIEVFAERPCKACKYDNQDSYESFCDECVHNVYYDSVNNFKMANEA